MTKAVVLGSGPEATVRVAGPLAASHAYLTRTVEGVVVLLTAPAARERLLRPGDAMSIGPYVLTVEREQFPTGEERKLLDVLKGSDPARLVYADWLEEQGRTAQADYVRAEIEAHGRTPATADFPTVTPRLQEATLRVGAQFRALVARPRIENCTHRRCPQTWAELTLTALPRARSCRACQAEVHFYETVFEAPTATATEAGRTPGLAIDVAQARAPGDMTEGVELAIRPVSPMPPPTPPMPNSASHSPLPPGAWDRLERLFRP